MMMGKDWCFNMKRSIYLALASASSLALLFGGVYLYQNIKNGQAALDSQDEFIENAVSNDEIFGKSYGEKDLGLRETKLCSDTTLATPKIGYQTAYNEDGTKISIRYTALVSSLDVTAVWKRNLYDSEGNSTGHFQSLEYEATKAYSGITNGGVITYANEVEDSNGNHPYNYFVVYTLLDIPLATYSDCYLDAYLTIDDGNTQKETRVGAVNVGLNDFFSYSNIDSSFINKTDAGVEIEEIQVKDNTAFIPSHYLDLAKRYTVTKIKEDSISCEGGYVVIPNTITEIESNAIKGEDIKLCYMGDSYNWNSISKPDTLLDGNKLYYYSSDLTKCNQFNFSKEYDVVLSSALHVEGTPIEENITATCTDSGTADLVTYCEDCGAIISKTTIAKEALGHDYSINNATNSLGHSYLEHTCQRCEDYYRDSLVVGYASTYDYQTLATNDLYSTYKDDLIRIYSELYEGSMAILESTSDFTADWNDNSEHLVAGVEFNTLNATQAFVVANAFLDNNPQFFFLDNTIYTGSRGVYIILNKDYYTYSARLDMMNKMKETEKEFTQAFYSESFANDRAKAKFVHDYVANHLFYQKDSSGKPSSELWAHNIIGFMDMDESTGGVCECYAQSYLYLCRLVGIHTIIVSGPGHAWNYTEIDGSWYGVDVTWDDQDDWHMVLTTYFLASKETMDEEHTLGNSDLSAIASNQDAFQIYLPTLSLESGY